MQPANAIPDTLDMVTATRREGDGPVGEDENVEFRRFGPFRIRVLLGRQHGVEGDEVVVAEHLDLLSGLPHDHILDGQRVNGQGLGDGLYVFLAGILHIEPPDGPGGLTLGWEEVNRGVLDETLPGGGSGDLLVFGGVEAKGGHIHGYSSVLGNDSNTAIDWFG